MVPDDAKQIRKNYKLKGNKDFYEEYSKAGRIKA